MPTEHNHVLAKYHKVGAKEVQMAIDAAMAAKKGWEETPWIQRASIMMKAAELLATKYRYILNASCMLGQGKSPMQPKSTARARLSTSCASTPILLPNSTVNSPFPITPPSTATNTAAWRVSCMPSPRSTSPLSR